MRKKAIIAHIKDNVATVLTDLEKGNVVEMEINNKVISVTLAEPIPFGHKFSLTLVKSGSSLIKYGEIVGEAITDIKPGHHVHVHNVVSTRGYRD